jgi:hypothetical protein
VAVAGQSVGRRLECVSVAGQDAASQRQAGVGRLLDPDQGPVPRGAVRADLRVPRERRSRQLIIAADVLDHLRRQPRRLGVAVDIVKTPVGWQQVVQAR